MSAEAPSCATSRLAALDPVEQKSKVKKDLALAEKILDATTMPEKVKKHRRISRRGAQRANQLPGDPVPGRPPGWANSLGKSIAKATGANSCAFSLGGVRDEAEIRGHGALTSARCPQGHPVDAQGQHLETAVPVRRSRQDGADFRGDPSSALLEVLDPEQKYTLHGSLPGATTIYQRFITTAEHAPIFRRADGTAWKSFASPVNRG